MLGAASQFQTLRFPTRTSSTSKTQSHIIISTATSLRLSRFLSKKLSGINNVHRLNTLSGRAFRNSETANCLHRQLNGNFASVHSTCCFFNGADSGNVRGNEGFLGSKRPSSSTRDLFSRRQWTNALLAANVVIYLAQVATEGKLLLWGAKINSLIDEGQLWRLVTTSFLHANLGHLLINCYSLNSVGPSMENICGPGRFLAVYMTSAITSSVASYWFSKAPAVGASGAIFGLVGSLAVFVIRHRSLVKGSNQDLQRIAQVLALNLVIGLSTKGIDNWGHLGGLLGGAATAWLLGPAWKLESLSDDGRRIYADKAPVYQLTKRRQQRR